MKRILSAFLIVMLLAGCSPKPKEAEQPVVEPTKPAVEQDQEVTTPPAITPAVTPAVTPVIEVNKSNRFDARKVKAGDQVSGLRVTKVEVYNAGEEDYDANVDFEGEVTVSGTFKHNLNDEFLDGEISFKVDEESAALLPKLAHDQRYVWFMFMNHEVAEKALGAPGSEGEATVTIKNYSIKYAHTEIWNTADFVGVDKK